MAENRTYLQVVPLTDRLDYVGSMYANWAYCRAVERSRASGAGARRVPAGDRLRAAAHRESHDGAGCGAADTGAFTMFIYAFDQRERVVELFEELCGARLTYNYVRPGGVSFDVPEGWSTRSAIVHRRAPRGSRRDGPLFFGNVIARGRMKGMGALAEDAVAWGASGPTARISGVNWDLRKHDPYSVYPRIRLRRRPPASNGDCYDRGRVQACSSATSRVASSSRRSRRWAAGLCAEGLPRLIAPAPGDAYDHIESARGSLGVYLVSDGSAKPVPHARAQPAFCNLALLPMLAEGHMLSDLVVVLGSLDPVFGEVDR
jgi:NADH-quinone oxidoreductase subunit D